MVRAAFEVEAITFFEPVAFSAFEFDFEGAFQNIEKLFAFMGVGFAATCMRRDAEEVRLHHGIAPGKKFHAHTATGIENFAVSGADAARIRLRRVEKGENIHAIEACEAAKG